MPGITIPADFERILSEIECTRHGEAGEQFRDLIARVPAADARLLQYAKIREQPVELSRVLRFLTDHSDGSRLVPGLLPLIRSSDVRLRARAAHLIARGTRSETLARQLLTDQDPRVRANVVEGIASWLSHPQLLGEAVRDPHHRVATTAAVALYRHNPEEAARVLRGYAEHADARFRAAVAWAIGKLQLTELVDVIERLRLDEQSSVRWNALRATGRLNRSAA
jgi:HEAT repeat protein